MDPTELDCLHQAIGLVVLAFLFLVMVRWANG